MDDLSNKVGQRLSGSEGAEKGVLYTKQQMETLGLDRVYLQEVMVPKWVRGEKEIAELNIEQFSWHKFTTGENAVKKLRTAQRTVG